MTEAPLDLALNFAKKFNILVYKYHTYAILRLLFWTGDPPMQHNTHNRYDTAISLHFVQYCSLTYAQTLPIIPPTRISPHWKAPAQPTQACMYTATHLILTHLCIAIAQGKMQSIIVQAIWDHIESVYIIQLFLTPHRHVCTQWHTWYSHTYIT